MLARLSLFLTQAAALLLLSATPLPALSALVPVELNPDAAVDKPLPVSVAARKNQPDMENRALACTGCHGKLGVATADGYFPRIAGKPADYLLNQLRHFKSGARRFDGMNRLVKSLPDDYLEKFAKYFADLDLPYPAPEPQRLSKAETKRAMALVNNGDQQLNVPACKSCHGSALTGVLPAVPGLLGLPRDYLTAQLGAWKSGLRNAHAPDCMATIVKRLPVADLTAVAGWLAAQPVPETSKPLREDEHHLNAEALPIKCGTGQSEYVLNSSYPPSTTGLMTPALRQGQYLVRLGNCAACHSQTSSFATDGSMSYGGGVAIETPFGRVYGSNISSSQEFGIGPWRAGTFYKAMTEGIGAEGKALNPVFPYQFFAGISREDSDAMLQWLKTSEPVETPGLAHELRFPYGTNLALSLWRWLYVDDPAQTQSFAPPDSASIERGRYLVNTVMHCNACHGKRDFLGGFALEMRTGGQRLPGDGGYAPSLDSAKEAGFAQWSLEDIEAFLLTGHNRHADANGLMGRVVQESTQHLNAHDSRSVALYLKSVSAAIPEESLTVGPDSVTSAPLALWQENCSACHADAGEGKHDLGPPLAGRRSVQMGDPSNVIISILHGGFGPVTSSRPYPPGMPGFAHRLTDQEVATLATHIRQSWGNQGARVRAVDVQRLR